MPDATNARDDAQPIPEGDFIRAMLRREIEPIFPRRVDELDRLPLRRDDLLPIIETLCGANDSQDVEFYDGTLGVTTGYVATHERPVGQLQWNNNLAALYTNPGDVSGVRWGSGTLIANDLFLTAGHCFDQTPGPWTVPRSNGTMNPITSAEIAANMRVNFNFQFDPTGSLRVEDSYAVTQLVEYRLGGLDFAIVRLAGNPGLIYGVTRISAVDAAIGDMLCIIQHPGGLPKRIEAGPLSDFVGDLVRYNDIDTEGGTSGSGILGPVGTIVPGGILVGVHTNGGCTATMTGHNFGVRISSIIAASPTIRAILQPPLGSQPVKTVLDEPPVKVKALDDVVVPKMPGDLMIFKKITDDPNKVKVLDDPINKNASDSPKVKRIDDPKDKVVDDPKTKRIDDPKDKFADDRPGGINKGFTDPGGGINLGGIILKETPAGNAPFILATGHHFLPGRGLPGGNLAALEQQIREYQAQLAQIEAAIQAYAAEQARLTQVYQAMMIEYQALVQTYSVMVAQGRG